MCSEEVVLKMLVVKYEMWKCTRVMAVSSFFFFFWIVMRLADGDVRESRDCRGPGFEIRYD